MSKELNAFTRIMKKYGETNSLKGTYNDFLIIKKALLKVQEQEKILKIIDENNVDILDIRMSKTVDDYNFAISSSNLNRKELTEEEFDVLKSLSKGDI